MDHFPDDDLIRAMPDFDKGLVDAEVPGQSFTAMDDNTVIGVGGIRPLWPGVGEAWAIFPKNVAKYGRQIYRISRTLLEKVEAEYGYWRIQATARRDWDAAIFFLAALKFVPGGVLTKYGPDKSDHIMMARVK